MPFEIPRELIAEILSITRKEANLHSYDPNGAAADLPSVEDAVSRVDPSPDHLRCNHCKGRLLNGVNSVVCVFCGTHPDTRPDTVRFASTLAYRWLLSSLHFDGSEVVEVPAAKEMKLSELLDLEVRWTAPEEAKATRCNWGFRGSKLGGVDLNKVEENTKKAEEEKVEEDGWEADFQFTGASATREYHLQGASEGKGFASFDLFPSPSPDNNDLSEHLDSVFGSNLTPKDGGIAITSLSNANESWFDGGDLWSDGDGVAGVSSAGAGIISGLSEERTAVSHGVSSSSLDVDLFGEDQWQSNFISNDTGAKVVDEDEDASDDWDVFTGSVSASKSGYDGVVGGINGAVSSREQQTSGIDLFYGASSNPLDVDFGAFSQPDFFSRGLDNQNLATGLDAMQPETSASDEGCCFEKMLKQPCVRVKGTTSDNVKWIVGNAKVGTSSHGITKSKDDDDVETIMSQMHDLSFMLATELSIPQKKDPFISVSTE